MQALDRLNRKIHLRRSSAQDVAYTQYTGPRFERPHLASLIAPLLPQNGNLPRNRDFAQLLSKNLRGKCVSLLRRPVSLEASHLEGDPLGHGRVLDGRRSYTPKAQLSQAHSGRRSPNLSYSP